MTCIVGIVDKEENRVLIGGDSAGVANSSIRIRADSKVFKNKDFIFGCTSSFRMIQLLRYSFIPPYINDKEIYEYMCTDFINAVRDCFHQGGFLQHYEEGDEKGGSFLVGYKDRLFSIDSDFQVGETLDGISACGCGEDFALGAMYDTVGEDAESRIFKALSAAEYYSTSVARPFNLISTNNIFVD